MAGHMIFLDIDGTIRDFDGYIPESTIELIRKVKQNGHKVCISTGRPYCQIEKRILNIGFDGVISGFGSYVVYEGSCIVHKYFPLMTYLNLCDYLLRHECVIELQTYAGCYLIQREVKAFQAIGERIHRKLGKKAKKSIEFPKVINSVMDVAEVEKILFFGNELSDEEILARWSGLLNFVPLSIPNSEKWGGEIMMVSVNKAEGIKAILSVSGYQMEEVIAFGNSENDIGMLKAAGTGVVMGNGKAKVNSVADIITTPIREDGLKKAFLKLGLI